MNKKHNVTPFTRTGVKFFINRVLADTMNRLDYGAELNNISIKIGSRLITVPMCPESYENLCTFLNDTFQEVNNNED